MICDFIRICLATIRVLQILCQNIITATDEAWADEKLNSFPKYIGPSQSRFKTAANGSVFCPWQPSVESAFIVQWCNNTTKFNLGHFERMSVN